jgi:Fe2+ or Zn2+ uptake regulation protein
MTQQEVAEFLKKNPRKWFTAKEITKQLQLKGIEVTVGSITSNLKHLRKGRTVNHRDGHRGIYPVIEHQHKKE